MDNHLVPKTKLKLKIPFDDLSSKSPASSIGWTKKAQASQSGDDYSETGLVFNDKQLSNSTITESDEIGELGNGSQGVGDDKTLKTLNVLNQNNKANFGQQSGLTA